MHSLIYQVWSEKAADTALSLEEESRLRFRVKHLPRAYYLAHMSTEESAKSILLHAMSVSGTPESEMPKVTKLLKDHKQKIDFLVTYAARSSEQLREEIVELKTGLVVHINDLKNNTMHVSCKRRSVYTPEERFPLSILSPS
jgi:AbiV family abortive infection protein